MLPVIVFEDKIVCVIGSCPIYIITKICIVGLDVWVVKTDDCRNSGRRFGVSAVPTGTNIKIKECRPKNFGALAIDGFPINVEDGSRILVGNGNNINTFSPSKRRIGAVFN